MTVTIYPGSPAGSVVAPPSKSMAHRLLICAGLAASGDCSVVRGVAPSEDVLATLDCLRAVGVSCRQTGDTVEVKGIDFRNASAHDILRCRESGSTLRFLIPPLLLGGKPATFEGYGRLMERQIGRAHV